MTSKPHVLAIVENLSVPFDRRVWMELTTLRAAGYGISVICPKARDADASFEELEGISIYRHSLPPERHGAVGYLYEYLVAIISELRLSRKIWRKKRFKAIHICNPPDLLFLVAVWYKWRHRVRVVFDHHDLTPEMYEAKYKKRGFFYYCVRIAERLTFATADLVLSTNESYREIAAKRGKKDPTGVFVVRSGPSLDTFRVHEGTTRFHNGRNILVGYLGVMGEQDGVDYLMRAIHSIVYDRKRSDIQFHLIGGGPARATLEKLAKDLEISDYIEFAGWCSGEDLLERLSSCDLCVSPDPKTAYSDRSTMNKILEYMALAKPIVQFDLKENRRSAGEAALYADSNDSDDFARKILDLADSPDLRQRLGEEGRRRMELKLEWRHQAPNLLAAYAWLFRKEKFAPRSEDSLIAQTTGSSEPLAAHSTTSVP